MAELRDVIFKGCTRPSMLLGAPMKPVVLVIGVCMLVGVWIMLVNMVLGLACMAMCVPAVMAMRHISAVDDQRLGQVLLLLPLRLRQRGNHKRRGAHVYSPRRHNSALRAGK